ncbi:ATP-binding protein [Stagnihabitans tardus]|uniref:AAA family ATPase n=1 Tax=Stagnihabitans tardus TaxID=2699202 RepID=A0AAE4Y7C1_9RHOB|nr:AAA family ATPase [Stagnihabitans tardus]NBZ86484.1 AAA family ATPase [Stagnihabitans tardus]
MRLTRLDLTRYGHFTDKRLDFAAPAPGAPDLHVIFGPNEAGKSTLFSAWLDLLYGIPLHSRYTFLHPGPTMQIGASLTHAGGTLDLVRLKKTTASLQDRQGQGLPEATLQAALGGMSREGYAAMFSLDDQTLEEGGEAILSSRGDLGEMLFSASAGLAALSPQLDAMRRELDAFHKPRARASVLKTARDRLSDLDRMRRELDVTASAAQKLQRDAATAEKTWEAARATEAALSSDLDRLRRGLALIPQMERRARLLSELEPLSHLPQATQAEADELTALDQALREVSGQMTARAETIATTEARLAALPRDPAILPLSAPIAAASGLYALHLAALSDLPRRRDAWAQAQADLARQMHSLGLTGDPISQTLPQDHLARLRALLTRRDLGALALAQAETEAQAAAQRLADLPPPEASEADLQSLAHLMADLRTKDPEAQATRAAQALADRQAEATTALRALDPWSGDLTAPIPAPWQLAAWEAAETPTRTALADATHARNRALSRRAPTDAPSFQAATEARSRREAAWATHRAALTPETAQAFEEALRHDDRLTLDLAGALSAATLAQSAEQELALAEQALQSAETARQAHLTEIAKAAQALGLPGAKLQDLRPWLALRERALTAQDAQSRAETALAQADAVLKAAANDLAQALSLDPTLGLPRLRAEALARLDRADRQKESARQRALAQTEATRRAEALAQAQAAQATWAEAWRQATHSTPLALRPHDDPGLAALLDGLDDLSRRATEAQDLADRIAKMEANSAAFHQAAHTVLSALSLPETAWETLPDRLSRAQETERAHATALADLTQARAAQGQAQARHDALVARREALAARLQAPPGALSDHLQLCLHASRLRADLAEIPPQDAPPGDAATLAAESQATETRLALARADSETAFAALTEARRALAAVGTDDAAARIAFDRANLLHDLAEAARDHLALKLAMTAFDIGLRRYRESHRSAMLARASEAFRRLSRGAYRGLDAQPDGASEVLVAIPAQGGAKLAADLSKGTRFQLYLALRIAGYHEMAKARPPVPFIADDIMETFDDGRSAEAFGLLADMSCTGQVIYLTHHAHLCDIARKTCPEVRITDLTS